MEIAKSQKNRISYCCKTCDYHTYNKFDYFKHNQTNKHIGNILEINGPQKSQKSQNKNDCICGKRYKTTAGLWKHKKICKLEDDNNSNINIENIDDNENNGEPSEKQLMLMIMQDNNELKKMFLEIIKNGTHITNNNSHNKSFNLQFFLNETCKDAMNIKDFVESIHLQLSDLERVGEVGYIDGISNIIIKNLKALDVEKRPVHCTDTKREVLYIKEDDKWEKENEDKQKIRKVIKNVAYKNSKMLYEFKAKHPDCGKSESKFADHYNKLIIEAMGGHGDNDMEKEDKIIKKISKEIIINK